MEDPRRYCEQQLICFTSTLAATLVLFYVALPLTRVNQMILPLLLTLAVYPGFIWQVSQGKFRSAYLLVFSWAITLSLLTIHYAYTQGMQGAAAIAKGKEYTEEMFSWILTGRGAEGDPSLFIVPKLLEITVFALSSLATAGFAGLFLGAYLLDYMNFYVGVLLLHASASHFFEVALLSWQVYAILRVVGYVLLGTALSRISWLIFTKRKLIVEEEVKRLLVYALIFIFFDFILKATLANTLYQPLLRQFTELSP
ncbi:MAG: hypothetical protein ABWK01_07155 [Infirmifilum sp.]